MFIISLDERHEALRVISTQMADRPQRDEAVRPLASLLVLSRVAVEGVVVVQVRARLAREVIVREGVAEERLHLGYD